MPRILNRDDTVAGMYAPKVYDSIVLNDPNVTVQGDGWADMFRDAIKNRPDGNL
jgi:hypothetical protein